MTFQSSKYLTVGMVGENTVFDGRPAQIVTMAHVTHMDGVLLAEFFLQHDTLYLKHAEAAT